MLQQVKDRKIPLGVITNKPVAASELILSGLKVRNLFSVVVGGDSTSKRKPDPEPLYFASKTLKVRTANVLLVGDSSFDISCAKNAGCWSCGVLWGLMTENAIREAKPHYLIRKPEEILLLQ